MSKRKTIAIILGGLLLGALVPLVFILLDMHEFGLGFSWHNVRQIQSSQRIHVFSAIAFPLISALSFILFAKNRAAQAALMRSERKTANILNSMADMLVVVDKKLRIQLVNPAVESVLGYAANELAGAPLGTLLADSDASRALLQDMSAISGDGVSRNQSATYVGKTVKEVSVMVTCAPIYRARRELEGFVVSAKDVREQLQLQHQLIYSHKMSAVGELVGNFAHEINTPLAVIQMNSELLSESVASGQADPKEIDKMLKTIGATVLRISRIMRALRSYTAKEESEPFVLVSVKEIVEDVSSLCSNKFRMKSIPLYLPGIPAATKVRCQHSQFAQMLLNILMNAYEAVEKLPEQWVRVEMKEDADTLEFAVTDSGKIPDDITRKTIREQLAGNPTGTRTGFGLSFSKRIAESCGGSLSLDANSSNTRFVIRLPKHVGDSRNHV